MTDKSQTHSVHDDAKAREMAEAFMKLWQDKWGEMMQQQGWPSDFAMPNPATNPWQMPFMSPFMQGFGGGFTPPSADAARIEALEKRIAALEKAIKVKAKAKPVTKTKPQPKSKAAAAARKKPAKKPSKG